MSQGNPINQAAIARSMAAPSKAPPDARAPRRLSLLPLLCVLCASAVNLSPAARAADPAPPEPLNWDIVSEAVHTARAKRAADLEFQAGRAERQYESAKRGRVIGTKRNGKSWSGVDLTVNPCLFDTRERKREELDRLKAEAQTLREQAAELRSPEARWMPVINLWRKHSRPGAPEVGDIGVIESWSGDGDDADNQNSLPLEVSHVRFDGSVLVKASAEFESMQPVREGSFVMHRVRSKRDIDWYVLSGMPGAVNKTTGETLSADGVWIVSGTTTFMTLEGGAVTTLVIERVCDEQTALDLLAAETRSRAPAAPANPDAPTAPPSAAP